MTERKIVRVYYRSLYSGGKVWCETRDPDEVLGKSRADNPNGPFAFQKLVVEEVTHSWEPWDVSERESLPPGDSDA